LSIFTKEGIPVAVLQTSIEQGAKERNWTNALQLLEQTLEHGPKLVVFPEAFVSGVNFIILRQMAEPVPGPTSDKLSELAQRHSLHIVAGILEQGEDRKIYDSAIIVAPDGSLVAKYRRRYLWTGERNYITAGNQAVTADTALGRIGLLIGYDLCFPDACASFQQSDVDMIVCPASVFERLNFSAPKLALARAIDHHCYFLYSNAIGFHQFANMRYTGRSAIFADPYFLQIQMGAPQDESLGCLAQADDQPGYVKSKLCLEELAAARRTKLPFKADAAFSLQSANPALSFPERRNPSDEPQRRSHAMVPDARSVDYVPAS
jgi:deaminated glutathione amidase